MLHFSAPFFLGSSAASQLFRRQSAAKAMTAVRRKQMIVSMAIAPAALPAPNVCTEASVVQRFPIREIAKIGLTDPMFRVSAKMPISGMVEMLMSVSERGTPTYERMVFRRFSLNSLRTLATMRQAVNRSKKIAPRQIPASVAPFGAIATPPLITPGIKTSRCTLFRA